MICQFSNFEALEKSPRVCSHIKSCCFWSILIWASLNSHFFWYDRYPNFLRGGFLSKCERKIRFFKKWSSLLFDNSSRTWIFQLDFCFPHCQRIWKMKKKQKERLKKVFLAYKIKNVADITLSVHIVMSAQIWHRKKLKSFNTLVFTF